MSGFDNLHRIADLDDLEITATEAQSILDDLEATWGGNETVKDKIKGIANDLKADPIGALVTHGWILSKLGGVGIGLFTPASMTSSLTS